MGKPSKSKKASGSKTTTAIPDSHPVDAPLVSAATEEKVPNWQPSQPGPTRNGVVQQAPVPTDRPVRVYADGAMLLPSDGDVPNLLVSGDKSPATSVRR